MYFYPTPGSTFRPAFSTLAQSLIQRSPFISSAVSSRVYGVVTHPANNITVAPTSNLHFHPSINFIAIMGEPA
jgi:hypothetical protein